MGTQGVAHPKDVIITLLSSHQKYILSAAIVFGSNIARDLATFCLEMPG